MEPSYILFLNNDSVNTSRDTTCVEIQLMTPLFLSHLSSISCSLLWAASTSMPEPSVGTLGSADGAALKDRPISSVLGPVCSWTGLVSDEEEQVVESADHLWLALGLGYSPATSPISFRRLGLQLLWGKKIMKNPPTHIASIMYEKCTHSSSVLLLCFLMHLLSQLLSLNMQINERWASVFVWLHKRGLHKSTTKHLILTYLA